MCNVIMISWAFKLDSCGKNSHLKQPYISLFKWVKQPTPFFKQTRTLTTSGLYYENIKIVNENHHEWRLYYKC